VTHTLRPLTAQTTVARILKHATEAACARFTDLLTFTNNISVARRTDAIAHLLQAIEPLLSFQNIETLIVPPYLCRLLMKRLRDGPQNMWDEVDNQLGKALSAIPPGTRLGVEHTWFQETLENQGWEDESENKLRVSFFYFLFPMS
jgi:serine/threonine-protein kinase ATR